MLFFYSVQWYKYQVEIFFSYISLKKWIDTLSIYWNFLEKKDEGNEWKREIHAQLRINYNMSIYGFASNKSNLIQFDYIYFLFVCLISLQLL